MCPHVADLHGRSLMMPILFWHLILIFVDGLTRTRSTWEISCVADSLLAYNFYFDTCGPSHSRSTGEISCVADPLLAYFFDFELIAVSLILGVIFGIF